MRCGVLFARKPRSWIYEFWWLSPRTHRIQKKYYILLHFIACLKSLFLSLSDSFPLVLSFFPFILSPSLCIAYLLCCRFKIWFRFHSRPTLCVVCVFVCVCRVSFTSLQFPSFNTTHICHVHNVRIDSTSFNVRSLACMYICHMICVYVL